MYYKSPARLSLSLLVALLATAGCSDSKPEESAELKPTEFTVTGKIETKTDFLDAATVALLYDSRVSSGLRRSRLDLDKEPTFRAPWPYQRFQDAIEKMCSQTQPATGARVAPGGSFEFKNVRPGNYVVVVGIPPYRGTQDGQHFSRDWPGRLATEMTVKLGAAERRLPARRAWFLEVKVMEEDGAVTLRDSDVLVWPVGVMGKNDTRMVGQVLNNLEKSGEKLNEYKVEFAQLDEKARATGQPLHVKAAKEVESHIMAEQRKHEELTASLSDQLDSLAAEQQDGASE